MQPSAGAAASSRLCAAAAAQTYGNAPTPMGICRRLHRRRPMGALPTDERMSHHKFRRLQGRRPYGGAPYGRADVSEQEQRLVWKSSPRWATIKRNAKREADTGTAKQDAQSKLKLAQAKAAKVGVENLDGRRHRWPDPGRAQTALELLSLADSARQLSWDPKADGWRDYEIPISRSPSPSRKPTRIRTGS